MILNQILILISTLALGAPEANGPPLPYLMASTDVVYRIRNDIQIYIYDYEIDPKSF